MGFISLPRTTFLKFSPIFKQELCAASQQDRRVHVRFGSKTDIELRSDDARFTSKANIEATQTDVRFVPKADIAAE